MALKYDPEQSAAYNLGVAVGLLHMARDVIRADDNASPHVLGSLASYLDSFEAYHNIDAMQARFKVDEKA